MDLWRRLDFQPGKPHSPNPRVQRVRRKVEREDLFSRFSQTYRELLILVLKATWWPRAVGHSLRAFSRDGLAVERAYRVGRLTQFKQILALALGEGVPPSAYYRLDLYREENRRRACDFIFRHEIVFFLRRPKETEIVHDKYQFARWCAHHGWPHPVMVAHSQAGRVYWNGEPEQAELSVLAKPRRGSRGVGIVSLVGPSEEVRREFSRLGAGAELVLQSKVEPPPGRSEAPVLRLVSTPDRVVFDYQTSGEAVDTGMLSAARGLVERAHRELTGFPALGWDVIIGVDGPVLLEANLGWDVETPQRLFGPLADFEELL